MFKHLFKLMWNKRKHNFLFLSEILVSFMVIFAISSFLIYYFQNYSKERGLDYEKVWSVSYDESYKTKNSDSLTMYYENLKNVIKALPEVEEVSFSSNNIPYANSISTTSITFKGKSFDGINQYLVGEGYKKVWNMNLQQGRWFTKEDEVAKDRPIVINETLKRDLFGDQSAVGKSTADYEGNKKLKIIGVVQDFKANGDFQPSGRAMFWKVDTAAFRWLNSLLIKVGPKADAAFESRLYKLISNTMKNSSIEITHVSELRISKNEATVMPMIIFSIIAGFLILNVALGLFGVLWYNINKRKGEIGLRRAIGASGSSVSLQLVAESFVLASMSLIVGVFFALQFPLLGVYNVPSAVYLTAILLSVGFIYVLVILCALYPGKQAAAILPAVALHEE
jgi:putative ABC transport system permease protein